MPYVSMASAGNKIDGSVKKPVFDFLQKLQTDDTLPGLHIEPMQKPKDNRVRTGRVNDAWRAVLYKITLEEGYHYVYYGTWHHDEAIKIARSHVLKFNSALGAPEFEDQGVADLEEFEASAEPTAPETSDAGADSASETATDAGAATGHQGEDDAVVPDWANQLPAKWTAEALTSEAGIRAGAAQRALAAETQAELNAVINSLPEAQGLVLLGLANGEDLDAIRDELGLTPADETGNEDEQLDRALRGNKGGFVFVGDSPDELRDALESMEIDKWRVFLHPEQRRYVEGRWNGSYRLSGGAGTGKTVVLVHRARSLARENAGARILLTTFTRTLAESLVMQMNKLDADIPQVDMGEPGVSIKGIDQIAARVLKTAGPGEFEAARTRALGAGGSATYSLVSNTPKAWAAAVDMSDPDLPEDLLAPDFLEQEYVSVVLANGVTEEGQYLKTSRKGRGTALNRSQRKELWKVIAQFRRSNQMNDDLTYPEVAAIAAALLQARAEQGEELPFDHVLVDEAQDFHAAHWLLLRALTNDGPDDLFIAEDSHQRIYGQKVPLSRFGIQIRGRSRRLRLNYRTTAENLAYAISILEGVEYTDIEDEEESHDYHSIRSGPVPRVITADSARGEVDAAVEEIRRWLDAHADANGIAVLVRSQSDVQTVTPALAAADIPSDAPQKGKTAGSGRVSVMTMHAAKGMEFERVVVLGASDDLAPPKWQYEKLPPKEQEDAKMRERSLFYVAATRARDELVVANVRQ